MSTIRLEYDTEQQRWTLQAANDTHELTLPVLAKLPIREEFLDPGLSPIEIELPSYAVLSIELSNPLAASGTVQAWAEGGTLRIHRPGG